MKRILYLAIALLTSFGAIAQTVGIKVAAPIIKNNPIDNTITGYANLLNGGYHTVTTKAGRDSLVTAYNKVLNTGMVTYVVSVDSTYRWNGSAWLGLGKGTVSSVNALTLGTSGTDLNSTVASSTTTPTITLNVPDASATARGVVNIGTQTFAGPKYFSSAGNGFANVTYFNNGGSVNISTGSNRHITLNTPTLSDWDISNANGTAYSTTGALTFFNNNIERFKITPAGNLSFFTTPTTSASTYDLLTRNTSTGAVEKIASSSFPLDNAVVHLAGNETITGSKTFTSDVQIPIIPLNSTSAVSKNYIDNAITGITWKAAVRVATTANITLSGTQTIDVIALSVGDRVLVKNQTAAVDNGIYLVSATAWTRPTDADSGAEIETSTVAVTVGTLNKNTQWTCTSTAITIGTTPITFTQISGAGTYASGTGLTLTGNVFAIDGTVATLTGTQTLTNKSISGGQISSAVANATLASTVTTNANLTGDVTSIGNAATVIKINGTALSGLATGILKNTTATGVPSIAVAGVDYGRVDSVRLVNSGVIHAPIATYSLVGRTAVVTQTLNSQIANTFLASPNGAAGTPTFRSIVVADVPTLNQSTTGNAATATTLQTARTINGVSFNGSSNITVADATKLAKAGDIITGDIGNTSTGYFTVPAGTTAQRPTTPLDGMRRYNTTTLRDEFYANGSWQNHARLTGDTFTGSVGATSFIKTGGLSTEFLKADGSSDATSYATATGSTAYIQNGTAQQPSSNFNISGAGTVGGNLAVTGTATASNLSGVNTGDITLAAIGATPNANGASLSGQALTLQPASASFGGLVTTGTQTFAGAKTYNGAMTLASSLVGTTARFTGYTTVGTTFNKPSAYSIANDNNWAYGMFSDDAANFWMQVSYLGAGSTTRGFRIRDVSTGLFPLTISASTGNTLLGTTTDNGVDKLQVTGSASVSTDVTVGGNLAVTGTSTLTGNTRINGLIGIATAPVASNNIRNALPITGAASSSSMVNISTVNSDVTTMANSFLSIIGTQAATFTLPSLVHYNAQQNTFGAGSTVSNQYGFFVNANLVGATNNYGFYSNIPSGTNRWNFYANNTAPNFFNGTTLFGTPSDNGVDKVQIVGSASVSTRFGIGSTSSSTFLNLPSGTTTSSSLRIPASVAPTTPIDGDIWRLSGRTQLYDGTVTKDVLFDKANSVFADGIVGAIVSDGAGNFSKAPIADRVISGVLTTKTSAYTVTLSDVGSNGTVLVRGDATSAAFTITLPVASTTTGLTFIIKKIDSSANGVTVSVASTIDGVSTKVFNTQYSGASIMSNGTNYNIVGTF